MDLDTGEIRNYFHLSLQPDGDHYMIGNYTMDPKSTEFIGTYLIISLTQFDLFTYFLWWILYSFSSSNLPRGYGTGCHRWSERMDYRCYRRRIGLSHVRHRIRNYHGIYIEFIYIYIRHEKQGDRMGFLLLMNPPSYPPSRSGKLSSLIDWMLARKKTYCSARRTRYVSIPWQSLFPRIKV